MFLFTNAFHCFIYFKFFFFLLFSGLKTIYYKRIIKKNLNVLNFPIFQGFSQTITKKNNSNENNEFRERKTYS